MRATFIQLIFCFQGFKENKLKENLEQNVGLYRIKTTVHHLFCDKVLNLKKGDIGVVVNGRVSVQFRPNIVVSDVELWGVLSRHDFGTSTLRVRHGINGTRILNVPRNPCIVTQLWGILLWTN